MIIGDSMQTAKNSFVLNNQIIITNKKNILIDHIIKIIEFNSNRFIIKTSYCTLTIDGSNLEIVSMDSEMTKIEIKGEVEALYFGEPRITTTKKKEENFLKKLFK